MRFFFPDSQDMVDPGFDFVKEEWSPHRIRQRDDHYAHEALGAPAYTGILVSKAIVDGTGALSGRYTLAQRHRLYRVGVREFFRLDAIDGPRIETMGDCGAFTYVNEDRPPLTVDDAIDFYHECGFDYGVSVDHMILGYRADADTALPGLDLVPAEWRKRQNITFELAEAFLDRHKARGCSFHPIGVAQGWSPKSYAHAVERLQSMGYRLIAMGGMVPLKTHEILASLECVAEVRQPDTELHLFGVTRCEYVSEFASHGVTSFDSTAPLRRAFKDARHNYYADGRTYPAVRVPQVDGNPRLKRAIKAGEIDQAEALHHERQCLKLLYAYDERQVSADEVVEALRAYELLYDGKKDRSAEYLEVLTARPWEQCSCAICKAIGIHVILFRGAERNRRRGFHNLYVFNQDLQRNLAPAPN